MLGVRDELSRARLVRCLIQLACLAGRLCPASSWAAQQELSARLARCVVRDAAGRTLLAPELLQVGGCHVSKGRGLWVRPPGRMALSQKKRPGARSSHLSYHFAVYEEAGPPSEHMLRPEAHVAARGACCGHRR
eukprot:39357-Chlamydomonas_euryale.AAC.1